MPTSAWRRRAELLPVPDGVAEENALGEPLACLVNAQRRTPVELADRVALIGLGYMGLGMLQLLKLRGPSRIVAIDVREEARAAAMALGADESYHPSQLPDEYTLTNFGDWQSDRGFDVVVEGSGTQPGLTLAGEMVRAHGVLSILGYHQGGPRQVEVGMWNWKAIDVVNAHVRRRADLMESMRIGLELDRKGLDRSRRARHPPLHPGRGRSRLHRPPAEAARIHQGGGPPVEIALPRTITSLASESRAGVGRLAARLQ